MAMDIGTIRGLGTVVVMLAFIGVTLWAYSGKRKQRFDADALLPFADDPQALRHAEHEQASGSNKA
ncbi:cytochrome c oxidase cbb3-type subunit 4 [Pseudomonas citronellolis]|jgi:cytochrome c oxidase cbb3-type subunit 4|uniref:Cytochrome c oxidase cbb3-type subunit 4 n=3 Tax=Pseudomonas TaxID=286 RepID=A0A239MDH4_9PSED|nr:Cbb3-type cytochrome oxidase component FixQ [Pseudomonas citronellolis]GLU37972.1 cytochrome C oxidase cbb3-type subunit CcoQ [Pseudomonas sp. NBRC 100443]SDJ07613.1 cytochrome c oxidase cbb3-type subunit 4 [Pseudomonas delhiensis]SFD20507.1 cytochrome c oxidase cbb3-type subunit 4 [Pseudomonas citronellolis]SNT40540.1 cytochrome c oxidase cbb3-type subunit 4 [Pseudomonas delhiensis]